jgi:transcriptional regulatory protein LevR
MHPSLEERLDILVESGQITADIRQHVRSVVEDLGQRYQVQLDEDNAGAFVTHLALACVRVARGEAITEVPGSIEEIIRRHSDLFEQAKTLFPGAPADLPKAEAGFITMYLCFLLRKE